MSPHDEIVTQLAEVVGIAASYRDARGLEVETSLQSRRAILEGLGVHASSSASARESLEQLFARRRSLLPPFLIARDGQSLRVPIRSGRLTDGDVEFVLTDESGAMRTGRSIVTPSGGGICFSLPALPLGYWTLRIRSGHDSAQTLVICAPERCHEPEHLRQGRKSWGLTAQVYSLRSETNFGIGDYDDLRELADRAGTIGADFLGLSPVHALFSGDLSKISPYSPSSRSSLDTQLISPARIKCVPASKTRRLLETHDVKAHLALLRETPLVDRRASWLAKRNVLVSLWQEYSRNDPEPAFAAFRAQAGESLADHAIFEALSEHFAAAGAQWVGEWPEPYRTADSQAVREFATAHANLVDFHAWLQWQADLQLADAHAAAQQAGMSIGLFRDLAVGVDRAGSEVWAAPQRFASGLSIGAPPDLLGPEGQNWGLPPFNPLTLEDEGFLAFRQMVAANMRHAGAIRIDHAFQLQRLFLVPEGSAPSAGAYLTMPFEALLAVLCLESTRARCMVIAEDLGTSPEGFSDAIMAAGIYSYRVLSFEREANGIFKDPQAYPPRSLAVLTTHDLPTFRGWWRGLDVDLRHVSGRVPAALAEQEHAGRAGDREKLCDALSSEGLMNTTLPPVDPPLEAATAYLARSRAALTAIQLEDVAGELNQANLPGPSTGHPNWQRKLSQPLGELVAPGGSLARMSVLLANEGRGGEGHGATALAAPAPRATYRLQFHKDFTFDDAAAIVPYLTALGISHVYASPIQRARAGSMHGYDIVDHSQINPELGGMEGFLRLSEALKDHGLGLLLDIVPNHMGIGGADNEWWLSVLEWGVLSPHAPTFDIDWERLGANGKLILPFLGRQYGEALEAGELKLRFDKQEGSFSVWHFEHRFPLNPLTYPPLLDRVLTSSADTADPSFREVLAVSARLRALGEEPVERRQSSPDDCDALKRRLAVAIAASTALTEAAERTVQLINGAPGISESFDTLHRILESQSYRLSYWRVAASDINFRRFFDINTLAGVRIEEPAVFQRTHALIFDLVRAGRIQGLRIDHVDGLADPGGYIRALQAEVGPGFYILVEKILGHGEPLRCWPMAGTTGYDALNHIDGVLLDRGAAKVIETVYREVSGTRESYDTLLRRAKRQTLEASFASELEVLVSDLARIAAADRRTRDYTVQGMRQALSEIIERFPVYRSYISSEPAPEDRELIRRTVDAAVAASRMPDRTLHGFIANVLLGELEIQRAERPSAEHLARFRRRFQQLTGPVTAKSLEDTLFYRYGALIALNEVGGEPGQFGMSMEAFHAANTERRRSWPAAIIATATHDTKRGEDGRARLLSLTEIPERWSKEAADWQSLSCQLTSDAAIPDSNDRHLILQQLLAAWPLSLLDDDERQELEHFQARILNWVEKALREAKRHSSWINPNEAYETAARDLIARALEPDSPFLTRFRPLARELARRGAAKGLARTILKLTVPGVPDFYQGTEFWDFSLVDPDNRRPVDFSTRERALQDDTGIDLASWHDGRIKQRLIARLLRDRAASRRLYAHGDYRPVAVQGPRSEELVAFTRSAGRDSLLVVVSRFSGTNGQIGSNWDGTTIAVGGGGWRDLLTGREIEMDAQGCPAAVALADLPFAVLRQS
jgi:(1->4)-alpha-D-glucan 1-alpha-D-glucosylmutase